MKPANKQTRIPRAEDVWELGCLIKEGESAALVGIGSAGLSRFAQSFCTERVKRFIFGDEWQRYLIVYIDGDGLVEDSAWGLYLGIIESIISELENSISLIVTYPNIQEVLVQLHNYQNNIIQAVSISPPLQALPSKQQIPRRLSSDAERILEYLSTEDPIFRTPSSIRIKLGFDSKHDFLSAIDELVIHSLVQWQDDWYDITIKGQEYLDQAEYQQKFATLSQSTLSVQYIAQQKPYLAYLWMTRAITMLFRALMFERIVFIFDKVDRLFKCESLDPMLFRHLKSLRDRHKYRLCYIIATRRAINQLTGTRLKEIENFYALVKVNNIPISLYNIEDAESMLQALMERNNFSIPKEVQTALVYLTGCHPNLLRLAFFVTIQNQNNLETMTGLRLQATSNDAVNWNQADKNRFKKALKEILVQSSLIRDESYAIWTSLSEAERVVLVRFADRAAVTEYPDVINLLLLEGLLVLENDKHYRIFSPIFETLIPWLAAISLEA
ncbi:MAG: hypothetical protein JXB47_19955 [Anaerolineae bacterium]|nr:hypothetical protein [Anaerolineae bacterium]